AGQGGQLDLEELDGGAPDGDLRLGDDRSRDQAHRLDRVLAGGVLDVDVDVLLASDDEGGRADALDDHAQLLEEEAQVLDHVVGRGIADGRAARVTGGGHQRIFGDGVATLGEDDRLVRVDLAGGGGLVGALGGLDVEPEVGQRGHVRLDR